MKVETLIDHTDQVLLNIFQIFAFHLLIFIYLLATKIFIFIYLTSKSGSKIVKLRGIRFVVPLDICHSFIFHPQFIMSSRLTKTLDFYGSILKQLLGTVSGLKQSQLLSCRIFMYCTIFLTYFWRILKIIFPILRGYFAHYYCQALKIVSRLSCNSQ